MASLSNKENKILPKIAIPGRTAGGDVLFSQKGFTYDFEFLHAFLSNRKNKIYHKQMGGGTPPFTPQIIIPGWTASGVCALWVSETPLGARIFLKDVGIFL